MLETVEQNEQLIKFSIADVEIAKMQSLFTGLCAETSDGYENVRKAIATTRKHRGDIEKKRKELKADAIEYGRKVDAEACRLTEALRAIEEPLQAEKDRIDEETERVRHAKAEKQRQENEAALKRALEAEEARLKEIRDQEEARLAEERKAIEAERAEFEAERARIAAGQKAKADAEVEALRVQRAAIEAEKAAIAESQKIIASQQAEIQRQKDAAERVEFERLAKIEAEKEASEKAQRDLAEKERLRIEHEKQVAEEARLAAAMASDIDKLRAFASVLRLIDHPEMNTPKAKTFFSGVVSEIRSIADKCETFTK